jgi:hypothetical protein
MAWPKTLGLPEQLRPQYVYLMLDGSAGCIGRWNHFDEDDRASK